MGPNDINNKSVEDDNNNDISNQSVDDNENTTLHSDYKVLSNNESKIAYHLSGMYQHWFLDYASYVILERAVPHINDGLKPVQRRILHSMKRLDDGRYNKVANIVGHTMQFHPHGDASIGDALVQLGQKELLIDCQGNWGNILICSRNSFQPQNYHLATLLRWKEQRTRYPSRQISAIAGTRSRGHCRRSLFQNIAT